MEGCTQEQLLAHPHVGRHSWPLLLLSRPRYLHVWAGRGPTRGLAVQQCHPEEEPVLRSAGSWLEGPGTKEEDEVAHSELSQRMAPPQLLSHGVLLQ